MKNLCFFAYFYEIRPSPLFESPFLLSQAPFSFRKPIERVLAALDATVDEPSMNLSDALATCIGDQITRRFAEGSKGSHEGRFGLI